MVLPGTASHATLTDLSNTSLNNTIQTTEKVASTNKVIPSEEISLTITSFSSNLVHTSKGVFTISESLYPIFKTANRDALTNATATVIVKNGEITEIKALTLNKIGTNKKSVLFDGGNAQISGNVTVTGDYNTVQNLVISKQLIVTSRVKKAITIDHVSVGDTLTFQPLRLKNISWLNVTLKDMITPDINVQRNKILLDSNKLISNIHITDDVPYLEVDADVGKLLIDVKKDFSLSGEGKIEKVTVIGGTNIYLESSHHFNKVQVDNKNAKVTYIIVDKTALNSLISSIQYVPVNHNGYYNAFNSEKWTTQADRTAFETSVSIAQAVANNTRATKEQVQNAITQLNQAIALYKAAQKSNIGDKNTLINLINSVQYVDVYWYNNNQYYNNPWTTQAEKDALVNAVSAARNVVNNYNASQYEITNAIYNLNNAITTYKSNYKYGYYSDQFTLQSLILSVVYVKVSTNGQDVPYYETWTTQSEKDSLFYAVASAQSILDNANATHYDISNAYSNLSNAISIYQSVQKNGYYY